MDVAGKRVVFLGGASGTGAAAIRLFAAGGAEVVFGDVQQEKGEALAAEIGDAVTFWATDASSEADVKALVGDASDRLGGLDVLVNLVGVAAGTLVEDMDVELWDATMAVNARSCFLAAKHAAAHLRGSGRGCIINTCSAAALSGGAVGLAHYAASQGAVLAFSRALSVELAPMIRVNCISPGHTRAAADDPWFDVRRDHASFKAAVPQIIPLGREAEPSEIAKAVLFLASDASSFMTGSNVVVDGGFAR